MTAPCRGNFTTAFLHRAGLLAGILAVLAGILGMHVMTGTHSMHSPATVMASTPTGAEAQAESAHDHTSSAYHASFAQGAAGAHEQCSCSDSCSGEHTMTVACTPSAKTGSLSAPMPGTAVFSVDSGAGAARTAPGLWSYLPDTPSPGELSISRT